MVVIGVIVADGVGYLCGRGEGHGDQRRLTWRSTPFDLAVNAVLTWRSTPFDLVINAV
ncbi:MAG: hypothetical protein K0U36_01640 [Alphaproteobacteria bacterium]|nr:hypothetical protein [Alphaproteobacteria bacterium]